jgi:hypothetical protein
MGLDFVEFVLGVQQVVKGFDRGLQRMSIGACACCLAIYLCRHVSCIAKVNSPILIIWPNDKSCIMDISGQRAVITCTPEYGYGIEGIFPLVPPNAHLIFDVTLLGFRPRPIWIKTLIQVCASSFMASGRCVIVLYMP